MKKRFISQLSLATICFTGIATSRADIVETTTSAAPTEYCVEQTSVRGGFDELVIDHHLIIPPADQFKRGDIFVAARFKSRLGALWLLQSNYQWRKIDKREDLLLAQHQEYEQLPLVVPVSVSYAPLDVTANIGDVEVWIGYGFRSAGENTQQSFDEMVSSQRYEMLWEALPPPSTPTSGIKDPVARICLTTSVVKKTIFTATTQ